MRAWRHREWLLGAVVVGRDGCRRFTAGASTSGEAPPRAATRLGRLHSARTVRRRERPGVRSGLGLIDWLFRGEGEGRGGEVKRWWPLL